MYSRFKIQDSRFKKFLFDEVRKWYNTKVTGMLTEKHQRKHIISEIININDL